MREISHNCPCDSAKIGETPKFLSESACQAWFCVIIQIMAREEANFICPQHLKPVLA